MPSTYKALGTGLRGLLVALATVSLFGFAVARAFAAITFNVTDYAAPGGDLWGTAFDLNGNLWVALPGCDLPNACAPTAPPGELALFNPISHQFGNVVSLGNVGRPLFVAVAPDGRVWFTMPITNSIGVYDPSNQTVGQWTVPTANSSPYDLAVDPAGKIWFTERDASKIATFDPATQAFVELTTPTLNSMPYGIAVDPNGVVWFTENSLAVAQIGEFTTKTGIVEYKIRNVLDPLGGLTPHLITEDQHGNPWWSEGFAGGVGTLNVGQAQPGTNNGVTEYRYSSCGFCGDHTSGIAYHNGRVWFDDSTQNKFGFIPEGGGQFTFFNSPGNHPHDGLSVNGQGEVFFDEEFSNALAETSATNGLLKH